MNSGWFEFMVKFFRKSRRKQKVLNKKIIYFSIIISLTILIILILRNPENKDDVSIKKIRFKDIEGIYSQKHYLKFDIENPTDEQKNCLLNVRLGDRKFKGYVNISAKSKKFYKIQVDIPFGRTEVKLDYDCS